METSIQENKITDADRKGIAIVLHGLYFFIMAMGLASGFSFGNESITIVAAVFTIIAVVCVCLANGLKELYTTLGIVLFLSAIFNFVLTKDTLQKYRIEKSYTSFINQNKNYENTENANIIKKALESYTPENYTAALNVLNKYDENRSQDLDKVMNLVTAIKQITPELLPDLKTAMTDNFVSLKEYEALRQKSIKNITLSKLTNEQLVLLGSIK